MNNNAYYTDTYLTNCPLEGYGIQFKEYLDKALSGCSIDISQITEEINKVDEHLTDVIINVEGNLASVAEQVQTNLAGVITSSTQNVINKVDTSTNEILCNDNNNKQEIIDSISSSPSTGGITKQDLDNAVSEIKENSNQNKENIISEIKSSQNEIISNNNENKNEIINSVISIQEDSTVKITTSIKTESEKAQERLEQIRQELINAINSTNSIVEMGFTDLNQEVINSRDTIINEVRENGDGIYITGGDVEK